MRRRVIIDAFVVNAKQEDHEDETFGLKESI